MPATLLGIMIATRIFTIVQAVTPKDVFISIVTTHTRPCLLKIHNLWIYLRQL